VKQGSKVLRGSIYEIAQKILVNIHFQQFDENNQVITILPYLTPSGTSNEFFILSGHFWEQITYNQAFQ
jgi:hypothetical protein